MKDNREANVGEINGNLRNVSHFASAPQEFSHIMSQPAGSHLIVRPVRDFTTVNQFLKTVCSTDRLECLRAFGIPLAACLKRCIEANLAINIIVTPDGTPVALCGADTVKAFPNKAVGWITLSTAAKVHRRALHRVLLRELRRALTTHDSIGVLAWARNALHLEWLRRVGAELYKSHEHYGPNREPFMEFIITKETRALPSRRRA